MIGLAAANAVIQFGVIVGAAHGCGPAKTQRHRRAGTALGVNAFWFGTRHGSGRRADGCRRVVLYAAIGIGMVVAVVMGISGGWRNSIQVAHEPLCSSGAKPIRCPTMMIYRRCEK